MATNNDNKTRQEGTQWVQRFVVMGMPMIMAATSLVMVCIGDTHGSVPAKINVSSAGVVTTTKGTQIRRPRDISLAVMLATFSIVHSIRLGTTLENGRCICFTIFRAGDTSFVAFAVT